MGLAIGGIFLDPLDLVDAAVSAARGNLGDAALGVVTAVPLLGIAAGITRIGKRAERVGRVFWSGGDVAKKAAMKFAKESGGVTLEMTLKGRFLDVISNKYTYKHLESSWKNISMDFAKGAKGQVNVFQSSSKGVRLESAWKFEYNELVKNGNEIIYHLVP